MLELKPMIHKFRMKDNYYCLDVNSGIIHVIDELIDRVLDIYDGTNRDAVYRIAIGAIIYVKNSIDEFVDNVNNTAINI